MPKSNENSKFLSWLWEFSKKIVIILSFLYIAGFIYSMYVMVRYQYFDYLGTFIEQSSDILRTCVFGYLLKAGAENISKIVSSNLSDIRKSKSDGTEELSDITNSDNDSIGVG